MRGILALVLLALVGVAAVAASALACPEHTAAAYDGS